jgi:dTDP-4-amino-4,6-dideoxygalactose transaminase
MFSNIDGITIPKEQKNIYHSYHLYPILINYKKFNISRINFLKKLKQKNINLQIHYKPAYKFQLYKKFRLKKYINSDIFFDRTVTLPVYFNLSNQELKFIVKNIKNILKIK